MTVAMTCRDSWLVNDRPFQRKNDRGWTHHDGGAKQDCGTTTDSVREVGSEWQPDQSTDVLNGVQQTQHGTPGVVEGALPLGKRLETVHHASVEAIGRGGDEQEGNPCVKYYNPVIEN